MKKPIIAFLLLCGMAAASGSASAQKTPVGFNISDAMCASSGDDVFFFEGGKVLVRTSGAGSVSMCTGTWKLEKDVLLVTLQKRYYGKPDGKLLYAASVNVYDGYRATVETINEQKRFTWYSGIQNETQEDCGEIVPHSEKNDIHALLRSWSGFVGKYPEASTRLLTEPELKKRTAWELKVMRNEIFARYGYKFTTKEMQDYFAQQPNYEAGSMNDVSAFLSETEKKNVALIKKIEATKK